MSIVRIAALASWIVGMILNAGVVLGQAYPNKPIRLLAGSVGGNADTAVRIISRTITGPLGQPVVVENRPANLLPEVVAKAAPDGYLLFIGGSSVWIKPFLQTTPYDPLKDLEPITTVTSTADILVVHPSLPVKSVKDLIALAKARPGVINYASGPTGNSAQLTGELFKSMAGVNVVLVPYPGTAQQVTALVSGEMQMTFVGGVVIAPHLKSGRLRALAIASAQPSERYPGLPTMTASLPGFESVSPLVIFAPGKTPIAIINRLNQEIVRALSQPDVKEKLSTDGADVVANSPEQSVTVIKADMDRMGKVIKQAGIHAE